MEYRVEQLAAACGVSVDTVRYYQSTRLLAAPRKEGRVAIYDSSHASRIREIRALQRKGLSLAVIRRHLTGKPARDGDALATAVASARATGPDDSLTLAELAERTGVPASVLTAARRAGLSLGHRANGKERFGAADVEAVRHGLRLLDAGLPLGDLLALGTDYDAAARRVAARAVRMFDDHVRRPIRASGLSDKEATERLVSAFDELLPAVTALIAHHFRTVLLAAAERRLARSPSPSPKRRAER